MAGDWEIVPLADLIQAGRSVCYGIVQPGSNDAAGIPIIRVSDIRGDRIATDNPLRVASNIEAQYSRSRLRGGELLLTLVGTVGETAIVPPELVGWNLARAVAVIPVRDEVGAYWVQSVLKSPLIQERIRTRLNTTVQATLNLSDVTKLPVVMPPASEREAICNLLGSLDGKIELNRRIADTLEITIRTLFRSWFIDFDPVHANSEGRSSGLPHKLISLFHEGVDIDKCSTTPQIGQRRAMRLREIADMDCR
jgi:type I restriction enzyme S subunit